MNIVPDRRNHVCGPQRRGVITRYVAPRQFGFIVSRNPEGSPNAGEMQTHFFHIVNVRYCQPAIPSVGCPVVFNENPRPAKGGKFPLVDNLEIYNPPEITAPNALAGVTTLSAMDTLAFPGTLAKKDGTKAGV